MWDWPFFAAVVFGVARAVDRAGGAPQLQHPFAKLVVLAWWLAIAALQAESVEGFAVLGLVPLGAYKVADVVAGAVLTAIGRAPPAPVTGSKPADRG